MYETHFILEMLKPAVLFKFITRMNPMARSKIVAYAISTVNLGIKKPLSKIIVTITGKASTKLT